METFVSISSLTQCGICLETFRCPVTTECGHSFCHECITKYWDGPAGTLNCPQCRRTFPRRPPLSKNICLDQITEAVQQVGTNRNPGSDPDPDLRTLCLAQHQNLQFYCQTERVAFCSLCNSQDHKTHRTVPLNEELTRAQALIANRQQSMESQIKTTSEEISAWKQRTASQQASLRRFRVEVEEEFSGLSVLVWRAGCRVGESLNGAETEILAQSQSAVGQLQQNLIRLEQQNQELQTLLTNHSPLSLLQGCQTLKKTPDCLPCPAAQSDVTDRLKNLRPATRELSDLLKKHLEAFTQVHLVVSTSTEQEDTQAQSAESQDSPHNLARSQSMDMSASSQSGARSQSMDMSASSQSGARSQSMDMSASSQSGSLTQSMDMSASSQSGSRSQSMDMSASSQSGSRSQSMDMSASSQDLTAITFDPNTASTLLHVSDNGRRVANVHPKLLNYPKHKERFLHHSQVLAVQLLSDGRHYWEISVSGSPVLFGLSYHHINRGSKFQSSCLGRNNASWCLELAEGSGRIWHRDKAGDPVPSSYQRLGLYVDIPGQTLSFYGISDRAALLHHLPVTFTHPVLPAFQINRGATIQIEN
ncbi:E3 ubiquitin-protein ligase TRIM65-like isoform X2 [Scyliorhinus torazame]|uniref:E3 ubiquitin-protein ligase TRIM65-like isoform X2 n=1 Tax=Scyliorhinus torazame TaxID=75743 RepID=UPI003B5B5E5F